MACAYDPVSATVVIFGGTTDTHALDETWVYDGHVWRQIVTAVHPPGTVNPAMAYDAVTHTIVLFGGAIGAQPQGDTWLWDGATATWTLAHPGSAPEPTYGQEMFTDPTSGHVVFFGGATQTATGAATWRWDGTTWQQLNPAHSPPARTDAAVALDPLRGVVVMFGGTGTAPDDATCIWDGKDWIRQAPATVPPHRDWAHAAFDPTLGEVVMYGGFSYAQFEQHDVGNLFDTWAWTGENWRRLRTTQAPRTSAWYAIAYDEAIGHLVLFGGELAHFSGSGNNWSDSTWLFVVQP
jgi:hypothetical protein